MPDSLPEVPHPTSPLGTQKALEKPVDPHAVKILHEKGGRPFPAGKELTPQGIFAELNQPNNSEHQPNPETLAVMREFGEKFQQVAVYIGSYLDRIGNETPTGQRARELAQQFAKDMHDLGVILGAGQLRTYHDIPLTPDQEEDIDHLLAGENLYQARKQKADAQAKAQHQEETKQTEEETSNKQAREKQATEAMRIRTLNQYFTALARSEKEASPSSKQQEQWQKNGQEKPGSFSETFRQQAQGRLNSLLENHALASLAVDIFSRESQRLAEEFTLPKTRKIPWLSNSILLDPHLNEDIIATVAARVIMAHGAERRLENIIGIEDLKTRLDNIRNSGDEEAIMDEERLAIMSIQLGMRLIPYKSVVGGDIPRMREQAIVNCVGSASIMGHLLTKLDIPYSIIASFNHTTLITALHNGVVMLVDPQKDSEDGLHIVAENDFQYADGAPVPIDKLHTAISQGTNSLPLNTQNKSVRDITLGLQHYRVYLYPPAIGNALNILNNIAGFSHLSTEESLQFELVSQAISPYDVFTLINIADYYRLLGKYAEALVATQSALTLDPSNPALLYSLGSDFLRLGKVPEAIAAWQQYLNHIQSLPREIRKIEQPRIEEVENSLAAQKSRMFLEKKYLQ